MLNEKLRNQSEHSMETKVLLFDIKRFAVHDGPGIRTTFFMKGCPLRCLWCQNPEGFNLKQEIYFFSERCISCNKCVEICPNDAQQMFKEGGEIKIHRDKCSLCGKCVEICPCEALTLNGKWWTIKEVIKKALADKQFYDDSDGGVTLSGGEPLMQPEGAAAILKELKKQGIHTAIETSGYAKWNDFSRILEYTDLVIFDLKHMDSKIHQKLTGVSNKLILENLKRIKNETIVRIPIIPGHNNSNGNIKETARFIKNLKHLRGVELLPYNLLAEAKYNFHNTGKYPLKGLEPTTPERLKEIAEVVGLVPEPDKKEEGNG